MATAATVHSHAPQGFIRKYIFSLDHKVIGIQYFFLALTAVFVGMFLSLLMRIHLVWPNAVLPLVGEIKPETYLSLLTMHGTIMVFFVLTTAPQGGFGNYFLPIQIGAPDMAFPVLNMLSFWTTFVAFVTIIAAFFVTGGAPLHGWTGYAPLSALPSAGPGEGSGRGFVDHEHCDFLRCVVDGGAELYYDYARSAGEGHDYDAHAADRLVVVHHGDFGIAGVWRVALGGNSAIDGSEFGDEFLCAAGGGERADHGAQGRIAAAVAASVLVLRASGGLHCDPAGDGRGFAGFVDVLAQTDFWI